jgi:hypothetical protein
MCGIKIGCGATSYPDGKFYTTLYTCNYGPNGNINSGSMYKKGTTNDILKIVFRESLQRSTIKYHVPFLSLAIGQTLYMTRFFECHHKKTTCWRGWVRG